MDTELRHTRGFKLHRTDVAERLMQPLPVVEHLDELKHRRLRRLARMEFLVMHQLILERAEEALDHGIVVAVPLAAHTGHQPRLVHAPLIGHTGIGRPLIRVMNQPGPWASVREEEKKRGRESLFGKASLLGHHLRTLNDRHPSKLARHLFRDGG